MNRKRIRPSRLGELAKQSKAQNYPKSVAVNPTGVWRESLRSYPGTSDKRLTEGEARPVAEQDGSVIIHYTINYKISTFDAEEY